MANVLTLNSPCFVIAGLNTGRPFIREHKLADFDDFIEQASWNKGQGPRFMADEVGGVWCVVDRNNRDPLGRIVKELESEQEARAAVEAMHVSDIINNSEFAIYTERSDAEEDLACELA